ncbi:M20 family metallopeptidase [Proteiniclasticum sp. QWL-01]|uniref:M20 metallopeptidase family protein n=1 Tax=Proteiniclasticum sp. QWL-01 TaxID=3036945 RepID=UPI0024117742|nr:M20 family metallopeptidase [Proteiniclasticum sp. QWL-01]WFF74394.1 M20 family metallopeptidase [Proteiniclasticum sp. QWL-01]
MEQSWITAEVEADMIRWRRDLHRMPELGLELPRTSAYVQDVLTSLGIEFKTLVNGNAIVGLIHGTGEGKVIGLRADMDGLPIPEETGLEFTSENDNMHACGHDGHTAMLLGAAKALQLNRDKFKGTVKLLFQPGEEYPGGALPMIEEGALENPKLDAVIGLHNGHIFPEIPKGMIGYKVGPMMASMDRILLTIKGKGSHGAYPHNAVDPISIAMQVGSALQTLVSRETKPVDPIVLSLCRIHGGFNQNIIPDKVEIEGTIRTLNHETRRRTARRIEELTQGIARAMRGDAEVVYDFKYPPLINDEAFTNFFKETAKKVVGEDRLLEMKEPVMGGEDMAYFLEKVPGTFFFLNNPGAIDGEVYPHHNSRFDLDESFFKDGAALLVQTVRDYLA